MRVLSKDDGEQGKKREGGRTFCEAYQSSRMYAERDLESSHKRVRKRGKSLRYQDIGNCGKLGGVSLKGKGGKKIVGRGISRRLHDEKQILCKRGRLGGKASKGVVPNDASARGKYKK